VLACDLASSQPAAGVSIILALKGANNEKALYIFPSLSGLFATKKTKKNQGRCKFQRAAAIIIQCRIFAERGVILLREKSPGKRSVAGKMQW